jgi:uncharacterized membrane protein YczE
MLLTWGLFLYAIGIVVTLNANVGYAPWDIFHVGLAKTMGISIGTASIIVGLIIGMIAVFMGEKLGFGTILNMVLIGAFLDIVLKSQIIPIAENLVLGIAMLLIGVFIIALATYFYIKSAFGAGPRDSLMVALTRKTGLSVGVCRGMIELSAVVAGWALGGMLGIGTIIFSFAIGFFIQTTFKLFAFDATEVKHETLDLTYKTFIGSSTAQACVEKMLKK